MFKFATNKLTKKQPEENETRRKLQKDLFAFNKIADKGFPTKPSAMDYDKKLKLLAIGTKNGDIRIYGAPGIQLSCYQDVPFPIQKLLFVQGTGQLISLVERVVRNETAMSNAPTLTIQQQKAEITNHLILWQIINKDDAQSSQVVNVEKVKEYQIDAKLGRISAIQLLVDNSYLFIGFENGDTYVFNVNKFEVVPGVINKDYIMKNLPDNLKKNPGAVESISHHPRNLTKLLIAYNRGLFVIYDFIKNTIDQIRSTNQPLESACFYQNGDCVATSHTDGSFILWDFEANSNSPPNIVYGPYPCRAVTKILVKTVKNNEPFVMFAGGVPRASYSDKISISVIQGEHSHVAFEFTSKVIDFITIDKPSAGSSNGKSFDNPQALLVLLEEEFVAIDLLSENWPQYKLPYLYSVHSSAIICTHYCNNVSMKLYNRLVSIGNSQNEEYSEREWPITSPIQQNTETNNKDLLLTGHEDGSVRFWDVTNMSMQLVYKLKTVDFFQTDCAPPEETDEENWPPFRKVGTFDPYSDDPKLGVQKIIMCPLKEVLVVAGTAGQVLIMSLSEKTHAEQSLKLFKINIVTDMDNFIWKGHDPLQLRDSAKVSPGYQPMAIIQLNPPATVSALALSTDWRLIGMGTSHGFALFDYAQQRDLLVRCTLDPQLLLSENASNSAASGAISRRKSLKKSLRESFRKLRRGRSQKTTTTKKSESAANTHATMRVEQVDDMDHKPIERQVESREFKQMDDIPPSVIRYMYFVRTYITNQTILTNSLWVGTNTGVIYIYALQIPERNNRLEAQVHCILAKEMRLKHRAPVVHIQVIDQKCRPIPDAQIFEQQLELTGATSTLQHNQEHEAYDHNSQSHKVIICSEEQFKVFQLPTLKPFGKFKLTAVEGARVRRIGYNKFISKSDPNYSEYCLSCLSNLGDLSVYTLPNLKRQMQTQCMKQQDINAITSFVFSKLGQAFYLQSPSELLHISMSACDNIYNSNLANLLRQQQQAEKEARLNNKKTKQPAAATVQPQQPSSTKSSAATNSLSSPSSPPPPVPAPRSKEVTTPRTNTNASANVTSLAAASHTADATVVEPSATVKTEQQEIEELIKENLLKEELIINEMKTTAALASSAAKPENTESPSAALAASVTTTPASSVPTRLRTNTAPTTTGSLSKFNLNDSHNSFNNTATTTNTDLFSMSSSSSLAATNHHAHLNGHHSSNNNAHNGSTSGISSYISDMSGVDLSMDSVVDRFNEEYNEVLSKIQPSINEENAQNSKLNNNNSITNPANFIPSPPPRNSANKDKDYTQSHHVHDQDVELLIENINKLNAAASTNEVDSLLDGDDNGNNLSSSSPSSSVLINNSNDKLTNNNINNKKMNGDFHHTNGDGDNNKIEQVTKRIENGTKLEYKETAID